MRNRISASSEFDDGRYWRFERNSNLPRGYFGMTREQRANRFMWAAIVVLFFAVLGLAATVGEVSDEEIRVTPRVTKEIKR